MKRLLLIVVLLFIVSAVGVAAGVVRFGSSQDEVTVTIDKGKLQERTEQVIECRSFLPVSENVTIGEHPLATR